MLVIVIASFSFLLSLVNASFDPLVISVIIAMFLGSIVVDKKPFEDGVIFSTKVFLPCGIALYGAQLTFQGLRGGLIAYILLVSAGLFISAFLISRVFNINLKTSVLLASGLSICGATAVAVISPLIGARREDTSVAIISVVMLGLAGMIFYPIFKELFFLTGPEYSFFTGSTLPMLGQVRVAAAAAAPGHAAAAVDIKLVRVSFLIFLVTAAVLLSGSRDRSVHVPWFVTVFVILSLLSSGTELLRPVISQLRALSGFFLSAGLAAIGFSVEIDSVIEEGMTPLGALFMSWSVVVLMMYLIRNLF